MHAQISRMNTPTANVAATGQCSAGPRFRLARHCDISRPGIAVYTARIDDQRWADLHARREIGYLIAVAPPRRSFVRIGSLWVDLDGRRRGFGRQLVDELGTAYRRRVLLVSVADRNVDAQLFFRALGFHGRPDPRNRARVRFARNA
jgi:ribosomal protein S18 acetylase RimI-like enzyme